MFKLLKPLFILLALYAFASAHPTWSRTYSYGRIRSIHAKDNGHIIFAAQAGSSFNVVHIDENGDVLWDFPVTGNLYDFSSLSSGQFMALYNTNDGLTLSGFSSTGQVIWSSPAPIATNIKKLIDTGDNCCVYASPDTLVKLNSDGSVRWVRSISSTMSNLVTINSAPGEPGGVSLAGTSGNYLQLGIADSSGTILWTGLGYNMTPSITSVEGVYGASNGNCYGAATFEIPSPPPVTWPSVLCFNPDSTTEWRKTIYDVRLLCESQGGDPIAFGIKNNLGDDDIFIRQMVAETGGTNWLHTHGIPGVDDNCLAVSLCSDGGYAVGGYSGANSLILRIDSNGWINGTGIEEEDSATAMLSPFPNPAAYSLTIPVSVASSGRVSIQIFDLTGRSVTALVEEEFQAGLNSVTWDLKDSEGNAVSNGMYCVVATTGEAVMTERAMVLR